MKNEPWEQTSPHCSIPQTYGRDGPRFDPWQKDEYEALTQIARAEGSALRIGRSRMEALFRENRDFEIKFFAAEKYVGKVGAFEGAMYEAKGYYRPEIDCIMFTRSMAFCAVCRRGIERVIDLYSRP
jgi:hypothetical protein